MLNLCAQCLYTLILDIIINVGVVSNKGGNISLADPISVAVCGHLLDGDIVTLFNSRGFVKVHHIDCFPDTFLTMVFVSLTRLFPGGVPVFRLSDS